MKNHDREQLSWEAHKTDKSSDQRCAESPEDFGQTFQFVRIPLRTDGLYCLLIYITLEGVMQRATTV